MHTGQDCCLQDDPYSDMALKTKSNFRDELVEAHATGKCPKRLLVFLVAWRSRAEVSTQYMEGLMSLVQNICKRAPNADRALVNARMSIKAGHPIDAKECCALDHAVRERLASGEDKGRFCPVVITPAMRLDPPRSSQCQHKMTLQDTLLAPFALAAARVALLGPEYVTKFVVTLEDTSERSCACVLGWSYRSELWVAPGRLDSEVGPTHFIMHHVSLMCSLRDYMVKCDLLLASDTVPGRTRPKDNFRTMKLIQYPYSMAGSQGPSLSRGQVDLENAQRHDLKWFSKAAGKKRKAGHGTCSEDCEDDGLSSALGKLMEEGLTEEEGEAEEKGEEEGEEEVQQDCGAGAAADCDGGDHEDEYMVSPSGPSFPAPESAEPKSRIPADLQDVVSRSVLNGIAQLKSELGEAQQQADLRTAGRPLMKGDISLINHEGNILFVRWTDASKMEARPISLDRFNRVKTLVAYRIPIVNYNGATVIIGDTTAIMFQTTASGRHQMPAWCLAMERLWQAQYFSGPLLSDSRPDECIVCEQLRAHLGVPAPFASDDRFVCKSCTSVWHGECACDWAGDPYFAFHPFVCPYCV